MARHIDYLLEGEMARKRKRPDPEGAAVRDRAQRTLEQARALIAEGEARIAARRRAEERGQRSD